MKYARSFTLSIAVALLLIVMAQVSPAAAQIITPPNCLISGECLGFPDADDTSGKFINVTRGLSSLGDVGTDQGLVNIFVIIPGTRTNFELAIFDGDMGGTWDVVPPTGADQIHWHLYPDPNRVGATTGEIWTEDAALMPDNGWLSEIIPNTEAARNGGAGDFYYHLVADWTTKNHTNEQNNFKVSVEGTPYLPKNSTVGFIGYGPNDPNSVKFPPTTYDGAFAFQFLLPTPATSINLYDGDMDRADDTDDANSPNLPPNLTGTVTDPLTTWPPFETSIATRNPAEGANLGAPADDAAVGSPLRISPSVIYHVTPADKSWTVTNWEPSGDKEWERFRILLDTAPPPADGLPADVTAPSLPAGLYEWRWEGLDGRNTVFINLDYDLYPGLGSLGNTVWNDFNLDGIWDQATEPGIPGVVVNLWVDVNEDGLLDKTVDQYLKSLTTAGSDGFYKFTDLDRAKYLVEVDASNFDPGGALEGYTQTPVNFDETYGDDHNRSTPWPVAMPTNLYYAKADFGFYQACGLSVAKTCVAPAPPSGAFVCSNAKPINSLTMIWNGAQNVRIKAYKGAVGSTLLADIDNIVPGQEVTVNGFAGAPNDVIWEIFAAGTSTKIGASDFHLSCSDADMNGPEDCGKIAGDAKGLAGFINQWKFDGMAGNGQILSCTPAPQPGAEQCEIARAGTPSCATVGKPTSLTFQYTGGGCGATNNTQGGKATCSGGIDPTKPVNVSVGGTGYSVTPTTVQPGGTFVVSRSSFDSNTYYTLSNAGGTEQLAIHTSCSQVLEVGNVFGSLTLVGFNGQSDKSPITFNYVVSNQGGALHDVTLTDDKLGDIGGGLFSLAKGETRTFTKVADIFKTTTNVATVAGLPVVGPACQATDSATVTVKEPCAVCKGGTVKLALQYFGAGAADVKIYDDPGIKADKILFQGPVVAGQVITLTPRPGQTKLNNDVSIYIGGVLHAKLKTDCSQPIGPNAVYGNFTVTEAFSKDNGRMCPLNACDASADTTLQFKDKEVKWKVTNNGDMPLVIKRITITWPTANGLLDEVRRDGDVVHRGNFNAPNAVITSGWDGAASKRTVGVGQTDELKFIFKNKAATNADYTITLDFDQGCSVSITYKPGTSSGSFTCSKPIDSLTMRWDGAAANIKVNAWKGVVGSTLLANMAPVAKGSNLTVSGFAGSPNDVIWEVFDATTNAKLGESDFHLSCSDADMNTADDCNKREGDAKGLSGYLNDWILRGMVDSDETLTCTP